MSYESPIIVFYEGNAHSKVWAKGIKLSRYEFKGVTFSYYGDLIVAHTYNFVSLLEYFMIF